MINIVADFQHWSSVAPSLRKARATRGRLWHQPVFQRDLQSAARLQARRGFKMQTRIKQRGMAFRPL
jgi:hypothetical protein